MKKILILCLCVVSINVMAIDPPDKNDVKDVINIFESIFKKTENTKKAPESKPVTVGKIYISREQLEVMLKDARIKGEKTGYKEGYRDGYKTKNK